jgi:hypothetical protein
MDFKKLFSIGMNAVQMVKVGKGAVVANVGAGAAATLLAIFPDWLDAILTNALVFPFYVANVGVGVNFLRKLILRYDLVETE